MKRILKATALSLLLLSGSLFYNSATAQYYDDDREISYQTFYDELSPYGRWVDYPSHGYVWIPDAGPDFRPYSTNGHWVWSDNYEWMWVSDYDWGWAPFHYGRWDYDYNYGWYWVPGYEWSSAWVAWRDGGDYYGWAPIRPGINISINFNIGGYNPPNDFWCFAPRRYINSPRIYDYYIPRHQNITVIHQTTIIINNYHYGNNYGFRSGPRRYDAESYCGRINPVRFRDSYRPGRSEFRNNEISIYRPRVRQDNDRQFSPRNVERYDRNNNTGFRRNDYTGGDNNLRQPQNNNGNNNGSVDRRRIDRSATNEQPQRQPQQIERRFEPRPQQQNNNGSNGSVDRRRIDKDANNEQPRRQPQQPERRFEPRQQQNNNNGNGSVDRRRFERTDNNPQPQRPQQVERKFEPRPQQMERRQQPQPSQQQPRQFERRDNRQQTTGSNNSSNSGSGNGRRRF